MVRVNSDTRTPFLTVCKFELIIIGVFSNLEKLPHTLFGLIGAFHAIKIQKQNLSLRFGYRSSCRSSVNKLR